MSTVIRNAYSNFPIRARLSHASFRSEVMDISGESIEDLGRLRSGTRASSFANNCLLARRLVEEGALCSTLRLGLGFPWDEREERN